MPRADDRLPGPAAQAGGRHARHRVPHAACAGATAGWSRSASRSATRTKNSGRSSTGCGASRPRPGSRCSTRATRGRPRNRQQRYRLVSQSQPFDIRPWFGKKAWFVLQERMHVAKGQIIALTLPTWAPVLATDLRERERWRSSRNRDHCEELERNAGPAADRPAARVQVPAQHRAPPLHGARGPEDARELVSRAVRWGRERGGLDLRGRLPDFRRRPTRTLARLVLPPARRRSGLERRRRGRPRRRASRASARSERRRGTGVAPTGPPPCWAKASRSHPRAETGRVP